MAKAAVRHEEMQGPWSDTFEYMNERVARDLKGFYVVYKRVSSSPKTSVVATKKKASKRSK